MTLWFVFVIMAAAAASLVALPFLRGRAAAVAPPTDATERLKAELAQVDLDQAVGEIDAGAAETARLDAQRRLLAAAAPAEPAVVPSARVDRMTAAIVVGSVVLGAVALYAVMGRPNVPGAAPGSGADAAAPTAMAATQPAAGAPSPGLPDVDTMIGRLEDRLKSQPNDAEGWRMLGWSYFATQKYPQAVQAYAKAVALNPKSAGFQSAYAEALNKAAGGQMTPEAKGAFETALKLDPSDARARSYLGLAPAPGSASASLPDAPAMAAAGGGDQQAMINGMVERQARELAANPRDAEGWVRLIRSRKVLGQPDLAHKALQDALAAFKDDAPTQTRLRDAARDLGVS
ncbi:MAG: c-type cytochrome biogenesis protein CcmI [Proteobacteria bacterium]|nr:c-type cytochrome biogenesis protein CcmI [Pseudomonadota bacterium]